MNRMKFIAGKVAIEASEKEMDGTLYISMGYLPKRNEHRGYKSGSVIFREPNRRKDSVMKLTPIRCENKHQVIQVLNDLVKYVEDNELQ